MNFKAQNWSTCKWVVLPSLPTTGKSVSEYNTIYYQKLVPGLNLTQGVYTNTAAGRITVTVWLPPAGKGLPGGACLCNNASGSSDHPPFGTWSSFVFSAAKMAWMQLSPSLKIANLTESVGHRDLHLPFNVSVTHKWVQSKFILNKSWIRHWECLSVQVRSCVWKANISYFLFANCVAMVTHSI